jgi:ketosteroid isomerase-like protein
MSTTENDQAVRALYDAWNRRDLDAWVGAFTPDATWHNAPTGETFTGPEGMAQNYRNWDVPFPDGLCTEIEVLAGDDFAVGRFIARGVNKGPLAGPEGEIPATGRSLAIPFCDVHRLRGGRIASTDRYWDQASVNGALGLG